MSHVDALSRTITEKCTDTLDDIITLTEHEYVKGMQYSNLELMEIMKQPHPSKSLTLSCELNNGVLHRRVQKPTGPRSLWVVPKCMRKCLAVKFYDLSEHFTIDCTVEKIAERYYFPHMRRYIKYYISMCPEYAIHKKLPG